MKMLSLIATNKSSNRINHVNLFTDGGCRGNPGPGAIGVILCSHENNVLHRFSECIGQTTNNRAEYNAIIRGLELCAKYTRRKVTCYSDSELVVKQLNGVFRLKNDALRKLFLEVERLKAMFDDVTFQHTRKNNQRVKEADKLLNQAFEGRPIDKQGNQ